MGKRHAHWLVYPLGIILGIGISPFAHADQIGTSPSQSHGQPSFTKQGQGGAATNGNQGGNPPDGDGNPGGGNHPGQGSAPDRGNNPTPPGPPPGQLPEFPWAAGVPVIVFASLGLYLKKSNARSRHDG